MCHIAIQFKHQLVSIIAQLRKKTSLLLLRSGLLWYLIRYIGQNDWREHKRLYGHAEWRKFIQIRAKAKANIYENNEKQ